MKKLLALITFCLCIQFSSFSQYANSGTGALKNDIWWFDWAGMNLTANPSKTVTTPDGLTITYTYYGTAPNYPNTSVMNTWPGAVLHFLYDFTNPAIQPALYQIGPAGNTLQFNLNVKVTRNGLPVPFTLVAVDAEASTPDEITTFMSSAGVWQMVDFFRNSLQTTNPVSGCNTNTVTLSDTYDATLMGRGQNPVMASATTTGDINIYTQLAHHVDGGMGVAFGIMAPIDRGDLPASYGYAYHGLTYTVNNGCNYLPPLPSATKSQTLKLGSVSGDADGVQTLDDNASGVDEDALTTFPAYYNNGTYSLGLPLNNTTGSDAYLTGWFDYNRNGVFDPGESVTVTVPNNSTSATLTWSGLPTWLPQGAVTDYGVRLRLSSDLAATQNATGFAKDGEVEDYIIPAATLCNINIQTINNATVCSGQPVTLTTTGVNVISYSWSPSAFLNDATIASPVANPTSTTTYTVTGSNPQGCIATGSVKISLYPPPNFAISPVNATVCENDMLQLTASGGDNYSWLDGSNSPLGNTASITVQPASSQTYQVIIKENTCNTSGTRGIPVTVNALPVPVVIKTNDVDCNIVTATLHASGGSTYAWDVSPDLSALTSSDPTATPQQTTTYYVKVTSSAGCSARGSVTVNADKQKPVITINNDTAICSGTAVQLTASATGTGVSYAWLPQTGLNNSSIATPVAQPTVATKYVVTATANNGCVGEDSVKITFHAPPNFVVSPASSTICENDQVQLTASGGDDYSWLDASNSPLGNTAFITVQPASSQTYRVIIKENTCNNSSTLSIPVTVNALPVPAVSKTNDVDCHLVTATLHASGGSTYAWDATTDLSALTSSDPTATPQQTTTYNVKVISSAGCSARTSVTVNVDKQKPVITVNNDTTICNGAAVQLKANATGAAISYAWLPQTGLNNSSIATPIAQPTVVTTYVVKATNGNNWCIGEDSVKIAFYAPPNFVVSPASSTICENDQVKLTASGGDDYTWLDAGNTVLGSTATITVQPVSSQTYQVIMKENTCNNSDTRSVPVTVNSLPVPSITKSNDIDCSTGQATLRAMGGVSYTWDAAQGIGNTISPNPVVTPSQTTTYFVTITNNKGCSARDSITVVADFAKAMSTYPVPSAFTPNNDGRNDCFGLKLWGQVTQLQFQVFNRWGQRVFATTDPSQCWDGTFKGQPLPAGGYAYTIKAVTRCGSVNRTGMVILIR